MAYMPQTPEVGAYQAGCADTLDALAMAFGLPIVRLEKVPQP